MTVYDLIKGHEGLRLTVYQDSRGILTIGYGRNLEGTGISQAEALMLLRADVDRTVTALSAYTWYRNLDSVRQAAIIDVTFDVGTSGILEFRNMITALIAQNWARAKAELLASIFHRQTGKRAETDAEMLLTGEWPDAARLAG